MPSEPPLWPNIALKVFVPKNQRCSSVPRLPSGFSRLCSGPAPKPSSEIAKPATRTFVMSHYPSHRLVERARGQCADRALAIFSQLHASSLGQGHDAILDCHLIGGNFEVGVGRALAVIELEAKEMPG